MSREDESRQCEDSTIPAVRSKRKSGIKLRNQIKIMNWTSAELHQIGHECHAHIIYLKSKLKEDNKQAPSASASKALGSIHRTNCLFWHWKIYTEIIYTSTGTQGNMQSIVRNDLPLVAMCYHINASWLAKLVHLLMNSWLHHFTRSNYWINRMIPEKKCWQTSWIKPAYALTGRITADQLLSAIQI